MIRKFEKILVEGSSFYISNFGVVMNNSPVQATSHPFRLNFGYNTKVKKSSPIVLMASQFDFVPFGEIKLFSDEESKILIGLCFCYLFIFDVLFCYYY